MKLSIADPKHPEFASVACIDKRGRVLLLRKPVRGDDSSVRLPTFEDKQRALLIHSHGDTDTPFSPTDLITLFAHPHDEHVGVPAEILATPSMKLLLLRTSKTPYLTADMAFETILDISMHPAMSGEHELFKRQYEAAGGEERLGLEAPPFTREYKGALQQLSHKRMFVLSRVAQRYHIKMYSCPVGRNVASPVG